MSQAAAVISMADYRKSTGQADKASRRPQSLHDLQEQLMREYEPPPSPQGKHECDFMVERYMWLERRVETYGRLVFG